MDRTSSLENTQKDFEERNDMKKKENSKKDGKTSKNTESLTRRGRSWVNDPSIFLGNDNDLRRFLSGSRNVISKKTSMEKGRQILKEYNTTILEAFLKKIKQCHTTDLSLLSGTKDSHLMLGRVHMVLNRYPVAISKEYSSAFYMAKENVRVRRVQVESEKDATPASILRNMYLNKTKIEEEVVVKPDEMLNDQIEYTRTLGLNNEAVNTYQHLLESLSSQYVYYMQYVVDKNLGIKLRAENAQLDDITNSQRYLQLEKSLLRQLQNTESLSYIRNIVSRPRHGDTFPEAIIKITKAHGDLLRLISDYDWNKAHDYPDSISFKTVWQRIYEISYHNERNVMISKGVKNPVTDEERMDKSKNQADWKQFVQVINDMDVDWKKLRDQGQPDQATQEDVQTEETR